METPDARMRRYQAPDSLIQFLPTLKLCAGFGSLDRIAQGAAGSRDVHLRISCDLRIGVAIYTSA